MSIHQKKSSGKSDKDFNQFLKKLNWLLNVQFYYSIKVIKLKKRQRLSYFLEMYLMTQKEIIRLLDQMYNTLEIREQNYVYDYLDVPRLEKEIDGISTVMTKQWNDKKEILSDKEMLGLVEEVGDSVKEPIKKVFGSAGNWFHENILRRHSEKNEVPWSVRNQGRINSGIKYMDEFANIGMRMAKGGF